MVTGDYKIDGEVNRFDANGVWLGIIKIMYNLVESS